MQDERCILTTYEHYVQQISVNSLECKVGSLILFTSVFFLFSSNTIGACLIPEFTLVVMILPFELVQSHHLLF